MRIILNDYVMNPGPSIAAIESEEEAGRRRATATRGLQPLRADVLFRSAVGETIAACPGVGAGEHIEAAAGEHGADPDPRTV